VARGREEKTGEHAALYLKSAPVRYSGPVRFTDVAALLTPVRFEHLPGEAAQARLAPRPRATGPLLRGGPPRRPAAGLVLIYPVAAEATLLLTVRGSDLASHGGQVSLPGGAAEPGESVEDTALREAAEEVGLSPDGVVVRGRLTPLHIPVSGYLLHPVVATRDEQPALVPDPREVERLIEVPLRMLAEPSSWRVELRERRGVTVEVPALDLGGAHLWGATAMVVAELLALIDPGYR